MTVALWFARDAWGDERDAVPVRRTASAQDQASNQAPTSSLESVVSPDESQLIGRVCLGDRDAFDALAELHWKAMWQYAYRLQQSSDAADDLVQDALFALWRRRETLDATRGVRGYLFGTLRRRSLELRRHSQVIHRAETRYDPVVVAGVSSELGQTVDAEAEHSSLVHVLARALDAFSPQRREVLILRWWHGLTYEEIAETVGLSVSAIKMQVARAAATLRAQLGHERP